MNEDIRERIILAWNQFEDDHNQKQPSKLNLTIHDEFEVLDILPKISAFLARKAWTDGVPVALPRIFGFPVVYRAKTCGFE